MQNQDAPAEILFKFWPWLEANKNRLIGVGVALLVAWGIYAFVSWRQDVQEVTAGEALSQLLVTSAASAEAGKTAEGLLQLAAQYPRTAAGQRARLQGAAALFSASRYAEAQVQFKKFLEANATGALAATAQLGIATCLEAQEKPEAVAEYQKVIARFAGSPGEAAAKAALSRLQKPVVKS